MAPRRTLTFAAILFLAPLAVSAQQAHKPGLWQTTTTTTLQQSPSGPRAASPNQRPHVSDSCVTQADIDKYGGVVSKQRGDCQVSNIVKRSNGVNADLVCTGMMSGKGTIEASWPDAEHANETVHFTGSIGARARTMPVEWTAQGASVYKGSDCSAVRPGHTLSQ